MEVVVEVVVFLFLADRKGIQRGNGPRVPWALELLTNLLLIDGESQMAEHIAAFNSRLNN